MVIVKRCIAFSIFMLATPITFANCGAAYCLINTNFESQEPVPESAIKFNLRYEFVKQNQARQGTKQVGIQGVPDTHDELETINHNLVLGLDYQFNDHWSAAAHIPYVKRRHAHLHNPDAAGIAAGALPEREEWKFTGLGDARLVGRYQLKLGTRVVGAHLGVKLPTGKRDDTNDAGEVAERSLQLGSGSSDLIASLFTNGPIADSRLSWFSQLQWQHALISKDNFRPGDELVLDLGLRYAVTDSLNANLQINTRMKRRDSGAHAEPGDSGGRYVFFSPDLSFAVAAGLEIYGYVQIPLYQYVNGTQLSQERNFLTGVSYRY